MTTYTAEQLQEIVAKHGAWLRDGEDGKRANLSYANLRYADLSYADLRNADLRNADLSYADLRNADLRNADLRNADLSYANLRYADLRYADLRYADLRYADLSYANLSYANLSNITVSWNAHPLLSEILYRASGKDLGRQALAALIGRNTGWCWAVWLSDDAPEGVDQDDWLGIVVDHREWALSELAKWVKDGDGAPEAVRQYVKEQPA